MSDRNGQTIFRNASADNPYTSVLTAALQDSELTPEAGWVLVFMLSQTRNWNTNLKHVAARRRMGRDRVQRAVTELCDRGYCKRVQARKNDGRMGAYEYWFTDKPGLFGSPQPEDQAPAPEPEVPAPVVQAPYKELVRQKEKDTQPPKSSDDALIPFSGTEVRELFLAAAERDAQEATGIVRSYVPGSSAVLAECHRLCIDPVPLFKRFFEKTKGRKIQRPDGYLIRMARDEAAQRDGLTVAEIAAASQRQAGKSSAAAEASVALDNLRRVGGVSGRTPNGSALLAALNGKHR